MKELLVLSPENGKPTKILNKKLKKISSFDAGFLFQFETIQYSDFHSVLQKILKLDTCFIVLGELTEHGRSYEETSKSGPRRKKKGNPTIQDKSGPEIVFDLDDHIINGFDPLSPEPSIKKWLKKRKINCDVTWQITSSQQLNTEEARIRLFMEADKDYELAYRKAYSQSELIEADGSVYTCSQPIYTAPPIIQKGKDPIAKRHGFIKGKTRKLTLPKITPNDIKTYSGHLRGGATYDFADHSLPEEFLSGRVYRRYLMPLAFHYANKGIDREAIFAIIHSKAVQCVSREFEADNVYEYIDHALEKIETEKEYEDILLKADDFSKDVKSDLPTFPEGILETLPMPWPMIWENFKKVPRQLEEPLLVPTVLSLNAFFLRSNYVTAYNRRPNFMFLNLTPSTGNKDVNSKNVIRDLDLAFRRKGALSSLFSNIINTESSITADTSFISSFSEEGELFWINTEATRIFQQLKGSGTNSSVAALSDKLIEVVDGHEITGKKKASEKVKTISDPNAQVLFYAQPETIEQYIDESMVDSGLFGRALLSIIPELKFDIDDYQMFMDKRSDQLEIDDDFYEFYTSDKFRLSNMNTKKKVLAPKKKTVKVLNEWAKESIAPLMSEDEAFQKVLSRIGNSTEQLYTVILGICQLYDAFNNEPIRKDIPIEPLLPLLEYWAETKVYAIKNFVNSTLDPMSDAILEIIKKGVAGGYKVQRQVEINLIKEHHVFPRSQVLKNLKQNKKLISKLKMENDLKNVTVRLDQVADKLIKFGLIVERVIKTEKSSIVCYGLPK